MQDFWNNSSPNQEPNQSGKGIADESSSVAKTSSTQPAQKIVFIDSTVENYQSLAAGVKAGTEVVILDSARDGVAQITQVLAGRTDIASVHIVSHGTPGSLQLGLTQINSNNLEAYTNSLQQWANALTPDADILLYGCNVAGGETGAAFVQQLSQMTGADVAASNDVTGSAALGGDWDLEVATGKIEAPLAFKSEAMQTYKSILPISLTLPGAAVSYTENAAATVIDSTATVTDTGSLNFDTGKLTVDFTAGGTASDRLAIRNQGNGAGQIGLDGTIVKYGGVQIGTFTGGTGTTPLVVTFNANATPAVTTALLQNITYQNASDNPSTTPRTVRFVVTDGDGSTSTAVTETINVTSVNDAPIIGASVIKYDGSLNTTPDDQGFTYIPFGSATQSASGGATTLDTTTDLNTYAGYLTNSVPTLDRATGYTVSFTAQVLSEDHTTSGTSDKNGDGISDRAGFSIIVLSSDKKGIELGFWDDEIWAQEDGTTQANPSANPSASNNQLLFTHAEGAAFNTTTGLIPYQLTVLGDTYTLSTGGTTILSGKLRDYTAASGAIDPYETPNLIFLGDDTTSASAKVKLSGVSVTTNSSFAPQTVAEDTNLSITGVSVFDVDAGNSPITVTLAVKNGALTVNTSGLTVSNNGTGSVTLTGPQSQINANLAATNGLLYQGKQDFNGSDTLTITANDGAATSDIKTIPITITPANDAPVLNNTGTPALTGINEDVALASNDGTLVSNIIASGAGSNPISDTDVGAVEGIAVIGVDNTNGTWQYSTNGGSSWNNFVVSAAAATVLKDTTSDRIRFVPNANFNGTVTPGITFRAWDASDGLASGTTNVNPGAGGGSSPFSTATETASIIINSINDAPSFTPGGNQNAIAGAGAQSVTGWATEFNPGPTDEFSQTLLGYKIVSNSAPNLFKVAPTINAAGNLIYTPSTSLGSSATATIGVTVQDNGGTANGGADTSTIKFFNITVNPNIAPLNVVINEVAWMGTNADFNDEWIELYNPTAKNIDLSGWTLTSGDGTPNITFPAGKIIPAGGYFLLERTDNTTVNSIPSDLIYTGSLGNASGETLTLKTPDGVVIDTANGNGGAWPAGANVTGTPTVRLTMERTNPLAVDTDNNWHRNDGVTYNGIDVGGNPIYGTPKAANSVPVPPGVTVTPITDLTTTEAEGTATFSVKLNTIPTANVTIGLTSSDTTEGILSTSSLIFTPNNWNIPQTVTITGVNDTIVDGNIAYSIVTGITSSTDANYNNINPADVAVVNNDNEILTVNITAIDADASETGANTGTFRISRNSTLGDLVVNMTIDGTSTASDYNLSGGSFTSSGTNVKITIPNGSNFVDITLTPNDDTLYEASEILKLNLADGSYTIGSDNTATVTIADNDPVPTLSISDVILTEGNLGTTDATFTVTLSAASGLPVTLDYESADGTANNSPDFTGINGTLTFAPSETTKTITVAVQGDTLNEINENFFVNLKNPSNATIADSQGTGTINNDDNPPSITIGNTSILEGDSGTSNLTFTVKLSAASGQVVTIDYATFDNKATVGSDYINTSGTLTFKPGETEKTVTVQVNGDTLNEQDEGLLVNLKNASNATIADNQAFGLIVNDDKPPSISISNATVTEGNSPFSKASFTISLSAASALPVTVNYNTSDGTATTVDGDYAIASPTPIIFAPGETSKIINVGINGDTKFEANETFNVNLSGATNATIVKGTGVATINNDDLQPKISISDTTVIEGNNGTTTNASFAITLSNPSSDAVTVNYNTSDGTATTADGDYAIASPTLLTFAPGETSKVINVAVNGDNKFEANETFNVNLSGATNATIAKGTGVGTINNDDAILIPSISISDATVTEGNNGTKLANFTVSLSNPSAQAIAVNYATANGSAIAFSDYTNQAGTLTFAPGITSQIITVPIVGDKVDEANETFLVNLSKPVNAKIADNQAVGTILDEDTAGFTISPISNNTTEAGGTATFTVKLNSQPTANVTLGLTSSDTTEGSVSTPSLTFTPNNWNLAQTVTVKGVDDVLVDGNIAYNIVTSAAISTDAKYNGLNPQDVAVVNIDNDTAPLNVINGTWLSETLVGTSLDDRINGFGGHDTIVGGLGKDRIYGDDGNDTLIGDLNNNLLTGGSMGMDDLIYGGTGNDRINGCGGNDTLYGEAGSDQIWGDGGDDRLYGGLGNDILTGGLGRDIFAVAKGEGTDTIRDFQIGQDYIGLVGGLTLNQLSIIQQGSNTSIIDNSNNQTLAILAGVNAATFMSSAASTFVSI